MPDHDDLFQHLRDLIKEALRGAAPARQTEYVRLLAQLKRLEEGLVGSTAAKAELAEVKRLLSELGSPPLQYGMFLGLTPPRKTDDDAALRQQEAALHLVQDALERMAERAATPDEAQRWQEARQVLLGLCQQIDLRREIIIGVGSQRYEVGLAVSNLKPEDLREGQQVVLNKAMNVVGVREPNPSGDTSQVMNILSPAGTARVLSSSSESVSLRVQLADGQKVEVSCRAELMATLRPGDVVQLDEAGAEALGRVKPRLHVRSGGSEGIVVEMSDQLYHERVVLGDMVRINSQLHYAFEKLPASETGGLALEEVPDVKFDDIGGLDNQISEIRDAIELPYVFRRIFEQYHLSRPKGILLYGPPGCGKTMIAKAVANSLTVGIRQHLVVLIEDLQLYLELRKDPKNRSALDRYRERRARAHSPGPTELTGAEALALLGHHLQLRDIKLEEAEREQKRIREVLGRDEGVRSYFINVKGPELLTKWVGETEGRIRKVFEEAKRRASYYTPVVIFFDEMEAMFRTRGSGRSSDVETTIVPQFLAEMDGVESAQHVILIGATNRPDMIDPAIMRPGRLDVKIKIERPGRRAAMAILALHLTPDLPLLDEGVAPVGGQVAPRIAFRPRVVQKVFEGLTAKEPAAELSKRLQCSGDLRSELGSNPKLQELPAGSAPRELLDRLVGHEWLCERLIVELVDLLFHQGSRLDIVTTAGSHYHVPLHRFVGGALLASIVSRAKKAAVKREISQQSGAMPGIGLADLRQAVREEFSSSADQLAAQYLDSEVVLKTPYGPTESVQSAEIQLGDKQQDPFALPKLKVYRKKEKGPSGGRSA